MSRTIVAALEGAMNNSYGLLTKFIEVCPDKVWNEVSGGWPVWQQVAHAAGVYALFAELPGEAPLASPFDQEIGRLTKVAEGSCDKAIVVDYLERAKARADKYVAGLDDSKLLEKHAFFSQLKGADVPHVTVLGLLASHTMYHLGSCDAALRDNGLKGVF